MESASSDASVTGTVTEGLRAGLVQAESVLNQRLSKKTKVSYQSGLNIVTKFIKNDAQLAAQHLDEAGSLKVPLPLDVVKAFFGGSQLTSQNKQKSYATMNSYRCALRDFYVEKKVNREALQEFDGFVIPFLDCKSCV